MLEKMRNDESFNNILHSKIQSYTMIVRTGVVSPFSKYGKPERVSKRKGKCWCGGKGEIEQQTQAQKERKREPKSVALAGGDKDGKEVKWQISNCLRYIRLRTTMTR